MNLIARQIYGNKTAVTYNTYIGGVASTISTASALATKLGISLGAISNFTIVGSDIKCKITGSYAIPAAAFNSNTSITYFNDTESLVSSVSANAFSVTANFTNFMIEGATSLVESAFNSSNCEKYFFPYCTALVINGVFYNCGNGLLYYLPICTTYGTSPSVNDSIFSGINPEAIIYAHPSMATINSGGVEADLAYAISRCVTVRYVSNFTAPSPITGLSVSAIRNTGFKLDFIPPSSTNTIDFYEVYVNGVFLQKTDANGYVRALLPSTLYSGITVKAVDIYYNHSLNSNAVSATTLATQTDSYPSTGLISYYKLDEISGTSVADSFGVNTLTNTSVLINQVGIIGKSYLSKTASNHCTKTSATIGTVTNFSINVWCYKTGASSTNAGMVEVGAYGGTGFGIWINNIGQVSWRINGNYNHYAGATLIKLKEWTMVTITYDGSNVKTYINAVLKQTTANTTNPASATSIRLFARGDSVTDTYAGILDEVSIHNVALSAANISLIYNNGLGLTL